MLSRTIGPALQRSVLRKDITTTRQLGTLKMRTPGLQVVSKFNGYILFLSFKTQPVVRSSKYQRLYCFIFPQPGQWGLCVSARIRCRHGPGVCVLLVLAPPLSPRGLKSPVSCPCRGHLRFSVVSNGGKQHSKSFKMGMRTTFIVCHNCEQEVPHPHLERHTWPWQHFSTKSCLPIVPQVLVDHSLQLHHGPQS